MWAVSAALLAVGLLACEVDKVPFSRMEEGKKFLVAGEPFQAAEYLREGMKREKARTSEAHAYLLVAMHMAAERLGDNRAQQEKFLKERAKELAAVRQDPLAVRYLVSVLGNRDLSSFAAAQVLPEVGEPAAPPIVAALAKNPELAVDLLGILEKMGSVAIPAMAEAISGGQHTAEQREQLVQLMGAIGGQEAQRVLRQFRQDATQPAALQMAAAAALYRLGDKEERTALIAGLDSEDAGVRRAASGAMVYLNETPSVQSLTRHLADADVQVRLNLVRALGRHPGNGVGLRALIGVVHKDTDTTTINEAARSLVEYGAAAAEPAVDAIENESDWQRRQRFVQVLKDDDVRKGLTEALEYRLYTYWEKRETNEGVKNDIAGLLQALEKK
jgi:HEAT repeat protein